MKKLAITIFFDAFILILLGLVIVMSASSTYSTVKFSSAFYLFNSHLIKVLISLFLLVVFCIIPYKSYKSISKTGLIVSIILLVATLIFAPSIKGAGRWLNLGFFSIQTAEVAKLALIVHLANFIEQKGTEIMDLKKGFRNACIWIVLVSGLILIQPNFSNAALVIIISLSILYVGGANWKHVVSAFTSIGAVTAAAILFYPHAKERVMNYLSAFIDGGFINDQVKQAVYSLGSGGLTGVGLGNSNQNNLFLPEAYGDFIFAILGEEFGLIGSLFVLLCYLVLFASGILIAKKSSDRFGQLLAFGISFSIVIYALINISVAVGLIPTTGLPLPFISYGGTSLLFLCISIGILVNIAMTNSRINKQDGQVEVQPINLKRFGYE